MCLKAAILSKSPPSNRSVHSHSFGACIPPTCIVCPAPHSSPCTSGPSCRLSLPHFPSLPVDDHDLPSFLFPSSTHSLSLPTLPWPLLRCIPPQTSPPTIPLTPLHLLQDIVQIFIGFPTCTLSSSTSGCTLRVWTRRRRPRSKRWEQRGMGERLPSEGVRSREGKAGREGEERVGREHVTSSRSR